MKIRRNNFWWLMWKRLARCQDGVPVVETSHVEVNADAGFVRFKPLKKTDEHVRYNCTATNTVGSDSEIGQLRVLGGRAL